MAKKTVKKAAKATSALDVLLKGTSLQTTSATALTEQFGSVMSLAQAGVTRLMQQNPQMHITEARDLHARAQAMSVVIARQFRERRLTAAVRGANRPPTGIKGLVDGPTYTDMFNPDWANHCPPDAIEATTSPVAYLADLYRYAKELEATGKEGEVITLDARRPDLKDLLLDHTALNRVEPTIVLVNEILEKSIRTYLDGVGLPAKSVDDALLDARYPNALPFERYTSQINYALGRKNHTLGDAIRAADPAYPYFKEPGVHSTLSDIALIQDTGFGPVQQGLLLEAPHFPATNGAAHALQVGSWRIDPRTHRMTKAGEGEVTASNFFKDNFGVGGQLELEDTQTFCLRTGLKTEELEALLSVGAFAPSRSENVTGDAGIDASLAGSVYINAGITPAMAIQTDQGQTDEDGVLISGPSHSITNMTPDRVDRMNRMIRLARWMDLPFDEVDQLLVASMQAEQRAGIATRRINTAAANGWTITENTLRALGLFQIMRRRYDATAEDFGALFYGLNVHGRGKTASQFDRVFNSQATFSVPLILDDKPFTPLPATEAERQKIDHLCAALGMTFETYRFVVKVVQQTLAGDSLRWSREIVSAFYRLVRLPRYLGLSTIEALALLELLDNGGSHLVSKLAGITQNASYNVSASTDTMSVIHALVDCADWLKENQWTVAQLCRLVLPSAAQPVATDAEYGLLQQMQTRLASALITESSFAQVGAPEVSETLETRDDGVQVYVSEPIDWFDRLKTFIDDGSSESTAKGLVKYLSGETEESFENSLSAQVKDELQRLGLPIEELHPKMTNMIMRARGAQEALLMEGLAGYLSTSADLAKALLFWSKGNRHQLLKEVLRVYGISAVGSVEIGDEVLLVLEGLSKKVTMVSHLGLSAAFIAELVEAPKWFGLQDAEMSMQLVYFSTQYATMLRLSEQDEETMLDYLRLINTLWDDAASDGQKRLLRDSASNKVSGYLHWGIREVLAVAYELHDAGIVFTLKDLDTVARVSQLSNETSLDAKALLALHALTPTSAVENYRAAAEMALSCLTDKVANKAGETGQGVSSSIIVTPDYLVANRPNDSATYTITLRDVMDEPYESVTVSWSTNLGELDQAETITNAEGVTSTTLGSGSQMGIANVVARFGLGEEIKAPSVTIDCDEATIVFKDSEIGPERARSNKLDPIFATVSLHDQYENKAIDRPVQWGATLGDFLRPQTFTDHDGVARAELRSRAAGVSYVGASYSNGATAEFTVVEFVSYPYFQYVKFAEVVTIDIPVTVSCRLVELDETPRANEPVEWEALDEAGNVIGELTDASSQTNADGVATVVFTSDCVGKVRITVKAPALDAKYPTSKTSELTTINPKAEIVRQDSTFHDFIIGSADPIVFWIWVEAGGSPAKGTLIDWTVTQSSQPNAAADVTTTRTDANGKATFSAKFGLGVYTVTATVSGTPESIAFSVLGRTRVTFEMSISGEFMVPDAPDLISRIASYTLLVKVLDESEQPIEGVGFDLGFNGEDPVLQGLDIRGMGQPHESTKEGVEFPVNSSPGGATRFTVRVSTRHVLEELESTYRLGWFYTFDTAKLLSGGKLDLRWVCVTNRLDPYDGPDTHLGDIDASVSAKAIDFTVPVQLKGRPLYEGTPPVDIAQLAGGDVIKATGLVAKDGYLIVLPGETQIVDVGTLLEPDDE